MERTANEPSPQKDTMSRRDMINQRTAERSRDLRAQEAAESEVRERIIRALESQIAACSRNAGTLDNVPPRRI
jgi:hypothetical protein